MYSDCKSTQSPRFVIIVTGTPEDSTRVMCQQFAFNNFSTSNVLSDGCTTGPFVLTGYRTLLWLKMRIL